MNRRFLVVTLVLQRPMRDYGQLEQYRDQFEWEFACAPTATTKTMLFLTDQPENEIRSRIRSLISEDDFCEVDSYDAADGASTIAEQAKRLREWVLR